MGAKAKDFNSLSGKYILDLIVGDAVIENPILWTLVSFRYVCWIQILSVFLFKYAVPQDLKCCLFHTRNVLENLAFACKRMGFC